MDGRLTERCCLSVRGDGRRERCDVLICGAGLTGLATALALADADAALDILVLDHVLPPDTAPTELGLRVSAITPRSRAGFEIHGAWQWVPESQRQVFTHMRVWDAGTESGEGIAFEASEAGVEALGTIVGNAALTFALAQACRARARIRFVAGRLQAVDATVGAVTVQTAGGSVLEASLLVGADGRNSAVRAATGMPVRRWSHDQCAVVAHLQPELPHARTALQRFLPDGPLALLPLADGRVSLVWSTTPALAESLLAADEATFAAEVTRGSDEILGTLALASQRASFPLISQYAPDPVARRTVLLGDAAHAVHPLAGQGANLGFADAAVLAEVLGDIRRAGGNIGDAPVLRRFRRRRKADNLSTLYGLDFINRLFARERGMLAELRRRGMRWFDANRLAKRFAAGHAMGATVIDTIRPGTSE